MSVTRRTLVTDELGSGPLPRIPRLRAWNISLNRPQLCLEPLKVCRQKCTTGIVHLACQRIRRKRSADPNGNHLRTPYVNRCLRFRFQKFKEVRNVEMGIQKNCDRLWLLLLWNCAMEFMSRLAGHDAKRGLCWYWVSSLAADPPASQHAGYPITNKAPVWRRSRT